MKKNIHIILLVAFVLLVISFPKKGAESLRKFAISSMAPSWGLLHKCTSTEKVKGDPLEVENQMLKQNIKRMQSWLLQDEYLQKGIEELLVKQTSKDPFFERRNHYLSELLSKELNALPAKVVFREPANWSSVFWVNVGEKNNREMGQSIVAKNSPVVIGKTIVGVVETVLENRSSVRLITDRSLTPSVRVVRGGIQDRVLYDQIETLIKTLSYRDDVNGSEDLARILLCFRDQLDVEKKELYLAKGEIHGTSKPIWRMLGQTLKGVGFHYDHADEEGPSRNLIGNIDPLISIGDVLVTTGMDGIFPPDFQVGIVTKVFPLKEGACSYSLEADALAPDLNTLVEVFILPVQ